MKYFYKLFVCFLMIVLANGAIAQKSVSKKRYWSIGGSLNTMNYVGDLDPGQSFLSPNLALTRYNFGLCILYRYSSRVSFRGAFSYGRIEGNDKDSRDAGADVYRKIRNSNFYNNIGELKLDVVVDLFESRGKIAKRPLFNPYLFAGVAGFYTNPQQKLGENGPSYSLLDNNVEDRSNLANVGFQQSKIQVAIPFGIGFRYKLAAQWDLAFEIGWRKTFTGLLDGMNGKYIDNYTRSDVNSDAYKLQETASAAWIVPNSDGSGTIRDDAPQAARDRFVQAEYGIDQNGNSYLI
ncbi:MAG: outer membrane beta-barrel protein, partial [Cytophagales bacterium]|nr:outer membrane beta-barrel protein [Cytophagales bacterium]